jgi:hypothetical protein
MSEAGGMKRKRKSAVRVLGLSHAGAGQPSETVEVLGKGTGQSTGSHRWQRRFVKRAFSLWNSDLFVSV